MGAGGDLFGWPSLQGWIGLAAMLASFLGFAAWTWGVRRLWLRFRAKRKSD